MFIVLDGVLEGWCGGRSALSRCRSQVGEPRRGQALEHPGFHRPVGQKQQQPDVQSGDGPAACEGGRGPQNQFHALLLLLTGRTQAALPQLSGPGMTRLADAGMSR